MFLKRYPVALTAACAIVALLLAVDPAFAARGGGGGRGGGWGGGRGGWSGGRGGWDGGRGGFYGGLATGLGLGYLGGGYYGGGYYGGGYYGGGYYPGYYSSSYDTTPYYYNNYNYYTPSTDYTTYSNYYTPAVTAPDATAVPSDRAQVEVRVPMPDAQVFFDGSSTQQQGMDRTFITPPLTPGKQFTYNVEARWTEDGRPRNKTATVTVTAGQTAAVDFGR